MATAIKHSPASLSPASSSSSNHSSISPQARDSSNGSVRVEIFDHGYNLRGSDPEYILKLAAYVDAKMRAVAEHTQTVDTGRVAVLAAINIADEYHLAKGKPEAAPDVRQWAKHLSHALDEVLDVGVRAG
jgi:cell division protein ZapA